MKKCLLVLTTLSLATVAPADPINNCKFQYLTTTTSSQQGDGK